MIKTDKEKRRCISAAVRFTAFSLLLSLICVCFGCAAQRLLPTYEELCIGAGTSSQPVKVVIDAGHGGEDGGAVGIDGTLEKDLNLKVALQLYDTLSALGVRCVMTRETDELLYDKYGELDDYKGKKKVYDLKNRLRFAEEFGECIFVSIHMNTYSSSKYSGLQVYYSPNHDGSKALAAQIQGSVRSYLQADNSRETKRAGSDIFILNRIKTPAVLVECGFLSNPEECSLLRDEAYRKKLALTLAASIAEYASNMR